MSPAIDVRAVVKTFRAREHNTVKQVVLAGFNTGARGRPVLKGVNLSVEKGAFVALIGRNGSGKSTLLRMMGGILPPDSGTIHVDGRIAPLIELQAGFHPDLTGHENLTLNAVILGLTRDEAARRAPDIIAFAGLQEHMNTPVRYFSSGMVSRLGFAITVMVDADVLLIDEVLAVGDEQFQQQCLATLRDRRKKGATIIFVSHDLRAVEAEADRVVWLEDGEIRQSGPPHDVVKAYREKLLGTAS